MKYTMVVVTLFLFGFFYSLNPSTLRADDPGDPGLSLAEPRYHGESNEYTANRTSVQVVSGVLFSPVGLGPQTPVFNYWQTNIRFGWMLNDPSTTIGFLNGNLEAILELSGSYVFNGFGSFIIGPSALLRYNFVNPRWIIVPYVQVGGGIVYTDAYKDMGQRGIGQAIEFTPQISIGFHYRCTAHWSLDGEAMYHHISNANLAERNRGINSLGGFVGVRYFFLKSPK
jgi:lipid A 3-O-deacylase